MRSLIRTYPFFCTRIKDKHRFRPRVPHTYISKKSAKHRIINVVNICELQRYNIGTIEPVERSVIMYLFQFYPLG